MLPSSHSQVYREFKLDLEELKDTLSQDTVDRSHLKSSVAKLQDFFQNQILTLDGNGLDPTLEHQVQSFQVEIDKQLKLLGMDGLFLQAAKQAATATQRINQASDRLTLLLRYCDLLLR
ncbi:MAG: heterocyst frequency control protein PatD [Leptolyngbyaceae cyanobacterium bins.349]|nr:heterocyst frequency control protein PatD [Leptolyngbyaceae cyanobacterium bins.349]